jgi:hypothetical protein
VGWFAAGFGYHYAFGVETKWSETVFGKRALEGRSDPHPVEPLRPFR